jgi:hypothetical protein
MVVGLQPTNLKAACPARDLHLTHLQGEKVANFECKNYLKEYKKHKEERGKNNEGPVQDDAFELGFRREQYQWRLCEEYKKHVAEKKMQEKDPQAFYRFAREKTNSQTIQNLKDFASAYQTRGTQFSVLSFDERYSANIAQTTRACQRNLEQQLMFDEWTSELAEM